MMMCEITKSLRLRENCVDGLIQEVLPGSEVCFGEPRHHGFASSSAKQHEYIKSTQTRQGVPTSSSLSSGLVY